MTRARDNAGVDLASSLAGKAPSTCLYLSGTSGNYVATPDAASLDITGDIDLRCHVALTDWTPASITALVFKWGTEKSYGLAVDTSGYLRFYWTDNGTTDRYVASTAATGATDGDALWVRATIDVDNGASQRVISFYTSTDGVTWSALGSPVTQSGATSIWSGTSDLRIGATSAPGLFATGKFYRAQVLNGIDGTVVADWRGDIPTVRYRDALGLIWTVNGTANAFQEV